MRIKRCFYVQGSLSVSQLQQVQALVQNIIQQNAEVHIEEIPLSRASQIATLRTIDEVTSLLH